MGKKKIWINSDWCDSYRRKRKKHSCLKQDVELQPSESTICRKNPELCYFNRKETELGDLIE